MDTQLDSTSGLDVNQAAALFANFDDGETEPKKEPSAEPAKSEPAKAEEQPSEPEGKTEPDEPPKTVTVTIDGKSVEVPLDELTASYQKDKASYQRFEEAASLRKEADTEKAKAKQERDAYAANLQQMGLQLQAVLNDQQQSTNWQQLLETDPVEYLKQQNLAQQRQAKLQQIAQQHAAIQQQQHAEAQEQRKSYLAEQQKLLIDKIPSWKDATKAKAEAELLRAYLKTEGFDDSAIDNASDARAVHMAYKAMKYDQVIANAKAAEKKVAAVPAKVERPGVTETPSLDKRSAAYQRLAKNGKVEDAAALFAQMDI